MTGHVGLYLAASLAVQPVLVRATMAVARELYAAWTADTDVVEVVFWCTFARRWDWQEAKSIKLGSNYTTTQQDICSSFVTFRMSSKNLSFHRQASASLARLPMTWMQ